MKYLSLLLLLTTGFFNAFGQPPKFEPQAINQEEPAGFNTEQYEAWLYTRYVNGATQRLPYRLLRPLKLDEPANVSKKYPLVIMLHGVGEAGSDNNHQLKWGGKEHLDAVNNVYKSNPDPNKVCDCFMLFPQEPDGYWTKQYEYSSTNQLSTALSQVYDVIERLIQEGRVDPDRVVIHGLSSGGTGTWASLYHRPDLFAAGLPMSAPGDITQMERVAPIPIWLFQGGLDDNPIPYISHQVIKSRKNAGAIDPEITRYSEYPNVGHSAWVNAYKEPDFFPWILRQNKNRIKVLSKNSLCPGETGMLGFSEGFYDYQWFKDGVLLTGETSNRLKNITATGTYTLRYRKTAAGPYITTPGQILTVGTAAPKPVISANQSLILPFYSVSSVVLSGPDGMEKYLWSNGLTSKSITVSSSGSYSLKTEEAGKCLSLSSDVVQVRVGAMGTPAPGLPTNVKGIPVTPTSNRITWVDIQNETGYEIYRSTTANTGFTFLKLVGENSSSYDDVTANPSTGYYYRIRAVNQIAGTISQETAYVLTFKEVTKPSIPEDISLFEFNKQKQLTIKWSPSTDEHGVKQYNIYSGEDLLGTSITNSFVFSQLAVGTSYMFSVEAEDYSGNKSGKSPVVPYLYNGSGLFLGLYNRKDPALKWDKLPDFTQLTPERLVTSGTPSLSFSGAAINSLENKNIITQLEYFALKYEGFIKIPKTGKYTFYIKSDDGVRLTINGTAVVTRNAPQGSSSEHSGEITFNSTGWFPFVCEYFEATQDQLLEVRWLGPTGSGFTTKNLIPSYVLSFLGQDPQGTVADPNTNLFRRLNLTDASGSPATKIKTKVSVFFEGTPDASIKAYELYRAQSGSLSASTQFTKIAQINRPGNLQTWDYIDEENLLPNTNYLYYVRFLSESGSKTFFNHGSSYTVGTTQYPGTGNQSPNPYKTPNPTITAPANAPVLQTVTGLSNSLLKINFTDPNNNESGYDIWRSNAGSGFFSNIGRINANQTEYLDNSGVVSTTYEYKIRAYNSAGFSAYSNVVSASTLNMPDAPTNLKVTVTGPNHLNLTWQNNSPTSGGGIKIFKSTSLNGNYIEVASVPDPALAFYQDLTTQLTQEYYFKVLAFNSSNLNSTFSNVVKSTIYQAVTPDLTDWRMPILDVKNDFKVYSNDAKHAGFNYNIGLLKDTLTAKKDFFQYLYIQKNDKASFSVKLPALSEIPHGGLITFNIGVMETKPVIPDSTIIIDEYFEYTSEWNTNYNYAEVKVYVSTDGVNFTYLNKKHLFTNYSNDLNKIDVTPDMAGKWVKIEFESKSNKANREGLLISEIGAYRFLGENVRHNYFLLCGASAEKGHPAYMGLRQFRKQLAKSADLKDYGKDALIFNISKSGKATKDLRDNLNFYLEMHPKSSYIIVHQGGNDINSTSNNIRPLTYERLKNAPAAKNFIDNFTYIMQTIQNAGKVPLISRLHFRDYNKGYNKGTSTNVECLNKTPIGPAVLRGKNQENGSLPFNLLLDSLTKLYTPYAYNFEEKRSNINYYPQILNNQVILGGDGVHPNTTGENGYKNIDFITNYWIDYAMRYAWTGQFAAPLEYYPEKGDLKDWQSDCGLFPDNKPNLLNLTIAAVEQAERTKSGNDIWEARILVEQLRNKEARIPYVDRLDALRDYRSPANPTDLQALVKDGSTISLSWTDNANNETGYEVYMSDKDGNPYIKKTVNTANNTDVDITGLSGENLYSFYVRAINGDFKSGWSNVVTARPGVTYYTKATGNIADVNTWGKTNDGSGDKPMNFTTGSQVYVIANRPSETVLSSPWTIQGNNSKLVLGQGVKLKVNSDSPLQGKVELSEGAQLTVNADLLPDFTLIDPASKLIISGNSQLKDQVFGDLQLDGTGSKTFLEETITIKGDLILGSDINVKGAPTVIQLEGDIIYNDNLPTLEGISIVFLNKSHKIDAKGGTIALGSLVYPETSNISLLNGTNLTLGSTLGGGLLPGLNSNLDLGSGELNIINNGAINPENTVARISSVNGSISLKTNSTRDSYLYPSVFNNSFKDITVDLPVGKTLFVKDSLQLINTLKLENGSFNTGDMVILNSDIFGTARIAKVEANASISGDIRWQKLIGPFKTQSTYYVGSPVKTTIASDFSKFFHVRGFNNEVPTIASWNEPLNGWSGITNPNSSIEPGKGYRVILRTENISGENSSGFFGFTGKPVVGNNNGSNTEPFNIPLTKNNSGWNLVSNPYPCEIDWNATGWDKTNIQDAFYVWDGTAKTYKVYVGAGGTGAPAVSTMGISSIINSGQGFMVRSVTTGNSNLSLTENVKRTDNADLNFYRMASYPQIRIRLRNPEYKSDEAIVRFYEDATETFDASYDALKFNGTSQNLATIAGSSRLTVNSLPYYQSTVTVPLHTQASYNGKFYLEFSETESFPAEVELYLHDKETGIMTDLRKKYSYNFDATSLDTKTRFELVFRNLPSAQVLEYNNKNHIVGNVSVFPNPAASFTTFNINLTVPTSIELIITDLNGTVIETRNIEGNLGENSLNWEIKRHNTPAGLYFYKIKTGEKELAGKIVVE